MRVEDGGMFWAPDRGGDRGGWSAREKLEIMYPAFARELAQRGFEVKSYDEGEFGRLARVSLEQPIYCGDGRREIGRGWRRRPMADRSLKVFGGVLFPAVMWAIQEGRKEIDQHLFRRVLNQFTRVGLVPGVHDLGGTWSDSHCGFAGLVRDRRLGVGFAPDLSPGHVLKKIGDRGHVKLAGEHEEEGWLVNLRTGKTRQPDGRLFATDIEFFGKMGLSVDDALALSAQVVDLLRPAAKTVYVAQ